MIYGALENVKGLLESIPMEVNGVKMPFSLTFIHNKKLIQDKLQELGDKQIVILDKYALKDENGKFVYKEVDGVRKEGTPSNFNDFDTQDINGMYTELNTLATETITLDFKKVNVNTEYYSHEAKQKVFYSDYVNQFLSADQISALISLEIFEL